MYQIVDKSGDLPRHPTKNYPRRNPAGVVLVMPHHAAEWGLTLEGLAKSHIAADPSRGKTEWPGAAYDYAIPEEDNDAIFMLHELHEKGYHCGANGMNTKALSIVLLGNFEDRPPPQWQIDKLVWLIIRLNDRDRLERYIVWHRDQKATLCPGKCFPTAEVIRRVAAHYDTKPEPNPTPEPAPEPEPPTGCATATTLIVALIGLLTFLAL